MSKEQRQHDLWLIVTVLLTRICLVVPRQMSEEQRQCDLSHSYSTSYKNVPGCTKANVKRAASMHTRRVTRNNFLEECEWLYAQVAFFGFPRQVFRGFKSQFASLTVRMLPRVSSGSVDRKGAQAKIHKLITRCRVANVFRREFSVYKPLTDDFPKVQTFLSNILIMSRSLLYAENCVKISST